MMTRTRSREEAQELLSVLNSSGFSNASVLKELTTTVDAALREDEEQAYFKTLPEEEVEALARKTLTVGVPVTLGGVTYDLVLRGDGSCRDCALTNLCAIDNFFCRNVRCYSGGALNREELLFKKQEV